MPRRIIIVEDEPIIALDIEQALVDAGCTVVGTAHTLKRALDLVGSTTFDGAILDANLGSESVRPIVEHLTAGGIPFLVVSGYSHDQLDFCEGSFPLVAKPFAMDVLIAAIQKHLVADR